ncbi:hypothetical protein [Streptomyces murinus]|uniref:hypothetical protein n=1 Tax=Streptomyces murinus TaxID=33900 RepID=UPI002E0E9EF7|nr:hypothetical protein OG516_00155 [Streptomyces murinus]WSI90322.1 hypothetical protein OG516_37585 [Streptomyces murinus]
MDRGCRAGTPPREPPERAGHHTGRLLSGRVDASSVTPARIRENFDVFGFTLTAEETQALAALDRGLRTGPHPDELNCARTHPF